MKIAMQILGVVVFVVVSNYKLNEETCIEGIFAEVFVLLHFCKDVFFYYGIPFLYMI